MQLGLTTAEDSIDHPSAAVGDRLPSAIGRLLDSRRFRRRTPTIDLNAIVVPNIGLLVVGLSVALLIAIVGLVVLGRRIANLDLRLQYLTRGEDGESLEGVLNWHLDAVGHVADEVDRLAARTAVLESLSPRALQRVGIVRFNPFEDTGGNQSFALALLDASNDGIVISSLHTRTATRIYAKALSSGRADGALSDEESQAVALAQGGTGPRGPSSARAAASVRQGSVRPAEAETGARAATSLGGVERPERPGV